MRKLKVISLFDGMSCGRIALDRSGIPVDSYHASEIDRWAVMVASYNFPMTTHIGDVCNLNPEDFKDVDLIIGGSPCQSLSAAGKVQGITTNDGQVIDSLEKYLFLKEVMGYSYDKSSLKYFNSSSLFWEYVRIYQGIKKYNPKVKFLLENVVNKFWGLLISKELGVNPHQINSSTVTAQNRDRYYWTNIEYIPIKNVGYPLSNVIPDAIAGAGSRGVPQKDWTYSPENPYLHVKKLTVRKDGLANCLTASASKTCRMYLDVYGNIKVIDINASELLQTLPLGYTNVPGVPEFQRFKMIGNGWTIDVISHFFNCLKLEIERKEMVISVNS